MNDKHIVVLLGGNILNSGIVDYCHNHDYFVIVIDWNQNAYLKGDLFLCIDVKDSTEIIQVLHDHGVKKILGAYTSIDLAVPSVNAINRHYGLKYMEETALEHALSKAVMTSIWQDNGILNRYSHVFESFDSEILDLHKEKKMIIKPNISSSSRGITVIEKGSSIDIVRVAFYKAKEESFDKKVIVEEFVEGREFTCEMLGDECGNVSVYAISVKYHTKNTSKNRIAIKLHYNSGIYPDELYREIAEIGKKCYLALGFRSSFGHLEIIMKEDGTFSPVEIGARSSGFIANPLVSIASGRDFLGDYFSVLNGSIIGGEDFINGAKSSMYFFYDMPSHTTVVKPCSIMDFLPVGIMSDYCNRERVLEKGFEFNDITNDNERIGFEIIHGERMLMDIAKIEGAEQLFVKHNTEL